MISQCVVALKRCKNGQLPLMEYLNRFKNRYRVISSWLTAENSRAIGVCYLPRAKISFYLVKEKITNRLVDQTIFVMGALT